MLDLFAARLEGKQVSVSSACRAACVSQSTAMRWVTRLTECGLLIRKADPDDGRRTNVELSDEAVVRLTNCIVARHGGDNVSNPRADRRN
jgi:DNA-binding MarR family transcriptional regulator